MKNPKYCETCKGSFSEKYAYRGTKYCSQRCYFKKRWQSSGSCIECGKESDTRFCAKTCFYRFHGRRKMLHLKQVRLEIIEQLGGKCVLCGFSDNRAIDIDHTDRRRKKRHTSYTLERRIKDWRKNIAHLRLLCANCHRIETQEKVWDKQRVRF